MTLQKKILTFALCLSLSAPLMGCDNPDQKAARYIKRGNTLLEKGEYDKARIEYKNAAKLKPTDAEPFYRMGVLEEEKGDIRNAFANFVAAEQQNSRFHPAALKIAQYYMAAEQYDESRKRIVAALTDNPQDVEAHALMAALLLREKKLDEAEKEARIAVAKDPANISACSALTGVYAAKNDLIKAVSVLNEGIARNPKNIALLVLRAYLYESVKDLPNVVDSYKAIFKVKPQEIQFRIDLAKIFVRAGKLDEAEASLREGTEELPDNWEFKHRFILFLNEYRSVDAAEAETVRLMKAYPKNEDLYIWLAELYANANKIDKATALLNQVIERGKFEISLLNARSLLARISIFTGNQDIANKLVAAVLERAPENREALLIRASMAFDNGNYENCISDLHTILRASADDREALQILGEALLRQNRLDLAIDTMKKLADIDPMNNTARVRLAQMVHMNGDSKQAMDLISFVTKASPDFAVGWEAAARIAIDAKEWLPAQEAVRALDKIEGQHPTAAFLDGQILEKNGKLDEALAKYVETVQANPKAAIAEHALTSLVDIYNKTNHLDQAARYLEGLKVDTPLVSTLLGKCYATLGKKAEAAAAYDKAIAASSVMAETYLDRAQLFLEEQKKEQAIDVLKKASIAVKDDVRAPLTLAGLLSDGGKHLEAIDLYESLLAKNPGLDVAANNLAALISDFKADDKDLLEKARKVADRFSGSTDPFLLDTLAWVYYKQGNGPMALTIMERAMSQNKEMPPQVHYHYGAILMKNGQAEKAKEELKKAVVDGQAYQGLDDAKKMLSSN